MNSPKGSSDFSFNNGAEDALFELERRVASRADELSFQYGGGREKDLEYWLQAEREILANTCLCELP